MNNQPNNEGIFHAVGEKAQELSNATQEKLANAGHAVKDTAYSGYEKVTQAASNAGTAVKDTTVSGYEKAKDTVNAGVEKVKKLKHFELILFIEAVQVSEVSRNAYETVADKLAAGKENAEKKADEAGDFMAAKKDDARDFLSRKADEAQNKSSEAQDFANEKSKEYRDYMAHKMREGAEVIQDY
ncbi:hypothetical protein OESDEN_09391 [Oesophagostomum dentatum]|uniref:Late embryogeneis abundant protein n=1 Tax=Oesophagostomum dentatum TaxID=61180 RepID=A0A0B1T4P2_OESDE|nr:hypothetical protein OESDEN_09391 [Oesophagostomum dentatum]